MPGSRDSRPPDEFSKGGSAEFGKKLRKFWAILENVEKNLENLRKILEQKNAQKIIVFYCQFKFIYF